LQREKTKRFAVAAIFATPTAVWSSTIMNPCLSAIYHEFQDSNDFLQMFLVTGASLLSIPLALLGGRFSRKFGKKELLTISVLVYFLGCFGGAFSPNIEWLTVTRTIGGATAALTQLLAFSIITDLEPEQKQRGKLMGFYLGLNSIYGAVISLLSGILAKSDWRYSFFLNGFAVVALIMVVFFLPKASQQEETVRNDMSLEPERGTAKRELYTLFFTSFYYSTVGAGMYFLIDLYVTESSLGTSVLSGLLTACITVVSASVSFCFGQIYVKLKRYTQPLSFAILAVSYLLYWVPGSLPVVFLATALYGCAFALYSGFNPIRISELAPASKLTAYLSVQTAAGFGGMFLCGYFPDFLKRLTGTETLRAILPLIAVLLSACALMLLIQIRREIRKKNSISGIL